MVAKSSDNYALYFKYISRLYTLYIQKYYNLKIK